MRQRKIKNIEERIQSASEALINDPQEWRGKWENLFGNSNPIYMELGTGKGQFIVSKAMKNSDINYIAIEGQSSVAIRALEKIKKLELTNIVFVVAYVKNITDFFAEDELSGMYLNFSDPWPKARHAKRRLTFHKNLKQYAHIIKNNGTLEFKTDNDSLFEFTKEEMELCKYAPTIITNDLHGSEIQAKDTTTEYEEKFKALGKNINYVKITFQKL